MSNVEMLLALIALNLTAIVFHVGKIAKALEEKKKDPEIDLSNVYRK